MIVTCQSLNENRIALFQITPHKMRIKSSSESEFSELEGAGVEPLTLDDIHFQPSYAVETFG